MKRILYFLTYIIFGVSLLACSSGGFDRGKLTRQLSPDRREVSDREILRVQQIKPQIRFPFSMAVYAPRSFYGRGPKNNIENTALQKLCDNLHARGVISRCVFISEDTIPKPSNESMDSDYNYPALQSIRYAAARYGAETVLTLHSASDVNRYPNILSILYLTVVGMWIIPGSHREAIYVYNASLWDVGNEYLYATAEGEATDSIVRPFALADDNTAVAGARELAIVEFTRELEKRLASLTGP